MVSFDQNGNMAWNEKGKVDKMSEIIVKKIACRGIGRNGSFKLADLGERRFQFSLELQ